jgi:hypothetical protein
MGLQYKPLKMSLTPSALTKYFISSMEAYQLSDESLIH